MLPNTFKPIADVIDKAVTPILVFVVGGQCNDHKSLEELELEKKIHNHYRDLVYLRFCADENMMPFPRLMEYTLYYFVPKNQTPLFWRSPIAEFTLDEDIAVAYEVMNGKSYEEARYDKESQKLIKDTDKMLNEEAVKEFPPIFTQLRSFTKDMWESAKLGMRNLPVLTTSDVAFARMQVCEGCDKYEKESHRCLMCGCNMGIKSNYVVSKCPLEKWPS